MSGVDVDPGSEHSGTTGGHDEVTRVVRRTRPKRRPARTGSIARIGILAATVAVVAAVFLPGTFVPDTLDMCAQATTGRITTWHAPVLAAMWRLFHPGPDAMLVAAVSTFVAASYLILRSRLRPWVATVATVALVAAPVTLGWLTTQSKDLWFTVSFLSTLAALSVLRRVRGVAGRWVALVVAVAMSWMTVATRSVSVVPLFFLWISISPTFVVVDRLPGRFRRVAASVGLAVVVVVVSLGSQMLVDALVVHPANTHQEQATYQFDLAGLSLSTGRDLLPAGSMRRGASLADMRRHFSTDAGDEWFFGSGTPLIHPNPSSRVVEAQQRAWISAIAAHPLDYLRLRASYTLALLGFRGEVSGVYDPGTRPERLHLRCAVPERRWPAAEELVGGWLDRASTWSVFRGWVFVLLLVAASLVAGWRRCAEGRALLVGGVASLSTFVVLGISPTFRYSWFTAVCALLCVGLALGRWPLLGRSDPDQGDQRFSDDHDDSSDEAAAPDDAVAGT